jgi:hypothetical protein
MAANDNTLSKSSFRNGNMVKAIIGVPVVVVTLLAVGLIREYLEIGPMAVGRLRRLVR